MADTKKTILQLYRKEVEDDARKGTDYLFHNKGNDHALIICSNIFKNAKREIRIAANQLYNDEVVNTQEYIDSMKDFLDKEGTMLKILITTPPPIGKVKMDNTFYGMLYKHPAYHQNRIQIKDGKGSSFRGVDGTPVNFCTADDKMYRYETDIVERKAVANFGDSGRAKMLRESFDKIYEQEKYTSNVDLYNYFR